VSRSLSNARRRGTATARRTVSIVPRDISVREPVDVKVLMVDDVVVSTRRRSGLHRSHRVGRNLPLGPDATR